MAVAAQFKSHALWWRDAGLDAAVAEQPSGWLDTPYDLDEQSVPIAIDAMPESREERAPYDADPFTEVAPPTIWPSDFAALQVFLAEDGTYPGVNFGRRRVLPRGDKGARLAILTDIPSANDVEQAQLLSGTEGELLRAMLIAMGLNEADCYIMSLATTRPASGELPESDAQELAAFALHHLALASISHALILGDAVSRFMLGSPMLESRGSLRRINHDGAIMAVANCFHPRTLLARPRFKKQAWHDMQLLMKELGQ